MRRARPLTIDDLMEVVRYPYIGGIQCAPPPWRLSRNPPGKRPQPPSTSSAS
jgi:hypothetical protein